MSVMQNTHIVWTKPDQTKAAAADATFLLVAGNDVNLRNIISNTVPTHFFFRVIMQPKKYIYFSKVVWFREVLNILVKEDHFLLWLQKTTHFHQKGFPSCK